MKEIRAFTNVQCALGKNKQSWQSRSFGLSLKCLCEKYYLSSLTCNCKQTLNKQWQWIENRSDKVTWSMLLLSVQMESLTPHPVAHPSTRFAIPSDFLDIVRVFLFFLAGRPANCNWGGALCRRLFRHLPSVPSQDDAMYRVHNTHATTQRQSHILTQSAALSNVHAAQNLRDNLAAQSYMNCICKAPLLSRLVPYGI